MGLGCARGELRRVSELRARQHVPEGIDRVRGEVVEVGPADDRQAIAVAGVRREEEVGCGIGGVEGAGVGDPHRQEGPARQWNQTELVSARGIALAVDADAVWSGAEVEQGVANGVATGEGLAAANRSKRSLNGPKQVVGPGLGIQVQQGRLAQVEEELVDFTGHRHHAGGDRLGQCRNKTGQGPPQGGQPTVRPGSFRGRRFRTHAIHV